MGKLHPRRIPKGKRPTITFCRSATFQTSQGTMTVQGGSKRSRLLVTIEPSVRSGIAFRKFCKEVRLHCAIVDKLHCVYQVTPESLLAEGALDSLPLLSYVRSCEHTISAPLPRNAMGAGPEKKTISAREEQRRASVKELTRLDGKARSLPLELVPRGKDDTPEVAVKKQTIRERVRLHVANLPQ